MELSLSNPIAWDEHKTLPDRAGVYVIAHGTPDNTVYIGRTWGAKGIRNHIRTFHRSAMTGLMGHAGGVTFHSVFNGDASDLFASVHLPEGIETKPEILRPYFAYAERLLIWEYFHVHGRLLACNSE